MQFKTSQKLFNPNRQNQSKNDKKDEPKNNINSDFTNMKNSSENQDSPSSSLAANLALQNKSSLNSSDILQSPETSNDEITSGNEILQG